MLDHYLALGGNEVVNSARAFGYATSADCAVDWLEDPECISIAEAEGHDSYDYGSITDAPWFDPDDPDTTGRFLGLYGIDILGLSASTRTATINERTDDGAVTSGYRHASREVRVRAWLTAIGGDALEAGMTWLRNVLEPNACGIHGGLCGEADTTFFVDCPPPRRTHVEYTDWVAVAVNFAMNPIAGTSWAAAYGTGGSGTVSTVTGRQGAPARRVAWTAPPSSGTAGITITSSAGLRVPVGDLDEVPIEVDVSSSDVPVFLEWTFYNAGGSSVGTGASDPLVPRSNVTSPTRLQHLIETVPVGAVTMALSVRAAAADLANGSWIAASRLFVGTSPVGYFDGNSVDSELVEFSWAGPENAAPSAMATRTSYLVPEGDATYLPLVDTYRRFLHSVRCISGPFPIEDRESSSGEHVGRLVEFTLLAEVPWVYGMPKEIEIPPLTPVVVQDVPYNLAPHPSAELSGAAVIVATNYSTNPSVETNATGWTAGPSVAITPAASGARSTELAAVGAASFKVGVTASNTGTNGQLVAFQDVTLAGIPAGSRISFSLWASLVRTSGTAVLGDIAMSIDWRDNVGTVLRTDQMGTEPAAGGALSLSSLEKPATAAVARVIARGNVTSWSSGAILALYADALAVTVP